MAPTRGRGSPVKKGDDKKPGVFRTLILFLNILLLKQCGWKSKQTATCMYCITLSYDRNRFIERNDSFIAVNLKIKIQHCAVQPSDLYRPRPTFFFFFHCFMLINIFSRIVLLERYLAFNSWNLRCVCYYMCSPSSSALVFAPNQRGTQMRLRLILLRRERE